MNEYMAIKKVKIQSDGNMSEKIKQNFEQI